MAFLAESLKWVGGSRIFSELFLEIGTPNIKMEVKWLDWWNNTKTIREKKKVFLCGETCGENALFLFFPVAPALGDKLMMMGEKCSGIDIGEGRYVDRIF